MIVSGDWEGSVRGSVFVFVLVFELGGFLWIYRVLSGSVVRLFSTKLEYVVGDIGG